MINRLSNQKKRHLIKNSFYIIFILYYKDNESIYLNRNIHCRKKKAEWWVSCSNQSKWYISVIESLFENETKYKTQMLGRIFLCVSILNTKTFHFNISLINYTIFFILCETFVFHFSKWNNRIENCFFFCLFFCMCVLWGWGCLSVST